MEKTFSQRVARFLEIVNYFLLIPTSLIEIATIFYGLMFLVNGDFGVFILGLVITAIYSTGNLLLYGYYQHSRGKLGNSASFWLWVGTITFNLIPLAYMFLIWMNDLNLRTGKTDQFWFYNIFAFYFSIILLAAAALIDDLRHERASL